MAQIVQRRKIDAMDNPKTKYMSAAMAERFAEMAERPDQLSMSDAITLLDVRESLLLEKLKQPAPDFERLIEMLEELRAAHSSTVEEDFDLAVNRMAVALRVGADTERTWKEIQSVMDQRRQSVESERRRIVQERAVVTLDQARTIVSRLLSIIDLLVDDRQLKARIMKEFRSSLAIDGEAQVVA